MENLNFSERIEKAKGIILNRIPRGKAENQAREFKKLVGGLGLSIEFFVKDCLKNNQITNNQKKVLTAKIKNFCELGNIKTTNSFFYKKNKGYSIVSYIVLL